MAANKTKRERPGEDGLTPRQHAFCRNIAKGMSLADSYTKAGYATQGRYAAQEAMKLRKKPQIELVIQRIQGAQQRRLNYGVDKVLGELDEMIALAKKTKQISAGVGAILGKAKVLGLLVDRAEVETTVRRPSRTPVDEKDRERKVSLEDWKKKFAPRMPSEEKEER